MGSLGLHLWPHHATVMAAAGGQKASAKYFKIAIRTNVSKAVRMVRDRAAQGRIALAVIRNPVHAAFVRKHAAVGGLEFAHRIGCELLARLRRGGTAALAALATLMGGQVLANGVIVSASLSEQQGFTIGSVTIELANGPTLEIPVCNEYMAVLDDGIPVVGIPDLIALSDRDTGLPLASTEIKADRPVTIFTVPRRHLLLRSTIRDLSLLRQIEKLVGIPLFRW
jgi:uncharacterized protein